MSWQPAFSLFSLHTGNPKHVHHSKYCAGRLLIAAAGIYSLARQEMCLCVTAVLVWFALSQMLSLGMQERWGGLLCRMQRLFALTADLVPSTLQGLTLCMALGVCYKDVCMCVKSSRYTYVQVQYVEQGSN